MCPVIRKHFPPFQPLYAAAGGHDAKERAGYPEPGWDPLWARVHLQGSWAVSAKALENGTWLSFWVYFLAKHIKNRYTGFTYVHQSSELTHATVYEIKHIQCTYYVHMNKMYVPKIIQMINSLSRVPNFELILLIYLNTFLIYIRRKMYR